jgi:hypothetical protein
MAFILLLAQKLLVTRVPELKPDELNPIERQLLAAAITEELWESAQVRRFLSKLSQQKKHAKLSMAMAIILLPRLKRHGIIPEEMDLEEITGELVNQAINTGQPQAPTATGPGGDPSAESDAEWDAVPVAAGGPPVSHRGNGQRQVDLGGVAPEAAPLRGDPSNEDGRYPVASSSGGEEPLGDEEPAVRSLRATPRPKADRPEAG